MTAQDVATYAKSLADSHDKLEQQVSMLSTELCAIADAAGVEPDLNKVVNEIKRLRALDK